jgi:diphthamide synthase (EF-2-diphthine--ammonia ligase)
LVSARLYYQNLKETKRGIIWVIPGLSPESMHGVRQSLLVQQTTSLGYPLEQVFISKSASNEEYEAKMQQTLEKYLQAGVSAVAFGDIFLEDLRKYREENLSKIGVKPLFPIWKGIQLNSPILS